MEFLQTFCTMQDICTQTYMTYTISTQILVWEEASSTLIWPIGLETLLFEYSIELLEH